MASRAMLFILFAASVANVDSVQISTFQGGGQLGTWQRVCTKCRCSKGEGECKKTDNLAECQERAREAGYTSVRYRQSNRVCCFLDMCDEPKSVRPDFEIYSFSETLTCRCRKGDACWQEVEWHKADVPVHDLQPFHWDCSDPDSDANTQPFVMAKKPEGNQFCGGMGDASMAGWTAANSTPSKYIDIRTSAQASKALVFASKNNLAVVVKSTGHDWFGRSSQPRSVLLWTHHMKGMAWKEAFTPDGCQTSSGKVIELEAGVQFMDVYDEMKRADRIFSGGTCSSVGHVGFTLGGGYGPLSRMYGSGATNLVQAEVALPDGRVVVTTACNEYRDLHWAVKGGGSGFGGLVLRGWYLTFPSPTFGQMSGMPGPWGINPVKATEVILTWLRNLIEQDKIKYWGGIVKFRKGKPPLIWMSYHSITVEECEEMIKPLGLSMGGCTQKSIHEKYAGKPCEHWDDSKEDGEDDAWCTSVPGDYVTNSLQRYVLPSDFNDEEKVHQMAQTFINLGEECWTEGDTWTFRINYALSGAPADVKERLKSTSVHPQVKDSVLLWAMLGQSRNVDANDNMPINEATQSCHAKIRDTIDDLYPNRGQYVNEGDRTEPNWPKSYWGDNYAKLVEVKAKYDKDHMFECHQCVGSESFSSCQ